MSDIINLIASKAPAMLRTGGGSLTQPALDRNFLTPKLETKLRELAKLPLNQRQIGEQLGVHQAQVSRWLRKLKIKATGVRKSPRK